VEGFLFGRLILYRVPCAISVHGYPRGTTLTESGKVGVWVIAGSRAILFNKRVFRVKLISKFAIRLMDECVQLLKRVLGLNHPNTLLACRTLAVWKGEQDDVVLSVPWAKDD